MKLKQPTLMQFTIVILSVIAVLIICFIFGDLVWFHFFSKSDGSIHNLHDASIIILTFLLVGATLILGLIARGQLIEINKTARADFLMRIDDRYGDVSIIKARTIIHRMYVSTNLDKKSRVIDLCKEKRDEKLSNQIVDMYEDLSLHEDFICLLNFLDFLEAIAYFSNNNHINVAEINELLGGSLEYFHKVFSPLISHLRIHYRDNPAKPSYYCELDKLINKIQSENKV